MLMHQIISPVSLDDYIRDPKLPEDKVQAGQVTQRCKNYVLVGNKLYQRGASSRVLMAHYIVATTD